MLLHAAHRHAEVLRLADHDDAHRLERSHERVGDYCMQNGLARFVVQDITKPAVPTDPTPRDLYSVGAFGGNIIDAVLVSDPTTDNFLEVQSMLNVETVANYQSVVVVNDGQDGTNAILRVCGPDDLLDFVNPSSLLISAGINPPGCSPLTPNCADDNDQPVVFMLWGSYAQKKAAFVDRTKHLVLRAPHPSPLSAHNGFFGCRHFSQANAFLESRGRPPIVLGPVVDIAHRHHDDFRAIVRAAVPVLVAAERRPVPA